MIDWWFNLRWSTFPHCFQMFPQDLPCSAVRHQAKETISVQITQVAALQSTQLSVQTPESKFSLAPVQPVLDFPLGPLPWIWTGTRTVRVQWKLPQWWLNAVRDLQTVPGGRWQAIRSWVKPAKLASTARLRTSLLLGVRGGMSRASSSGR